MVGLLLIYTKNIYKREKNMTKRVSIVLSTRLLQDIEGLQKILNMDKSTTIRYLLDKSIKDVKIDFAVDAYKQGKISFGKAAEIAGVSLWEFIDICHARKINLNMTPEDADLGIGRVAAFDLEKYRERTKKHQD